MRDKTLGLEIFERKIPFNHFLGMRICSMERGRVSIELPFRSEWIGDPERPALHGGVISALIDAAAGAAAWTELQDADRLSTVDLVVDYLRPARLETLQAEAMVTRIGNRLAVAQVSVRHPGNNEIVAQGRAVFSIVRGKKATTPDAIPQ